MLTSLPEKMNISRESTLFLPGKEHFHMGTRLFFVYLNCIYFYIPLFVKKIRIFARVFPHAHTNRWKYAILRTQAMQSVKMSTNNAEMVFQNFDIPYPKYILLRYPSILNNGNFNHKKRKNHVRIKRTHMYYYIYRIKMKDENGANKATVSCK